MLKNRFWRVIGLVFILTFVAVPIASATQFEGDDTFELAEGETSDGNLYAGGQTVTINGTVDGDLIAAGTKIILGPTGVVRGDMMAGGQEIRIQGTVEGDVRSAGFLAQVEGNGEVGGELVLAGFSIGALGDSSVAGDFLGFGYQGLIDGTIGGNANFGGSALDITGRVEGDMSAGVDADGSGAAPTFFFPGMPTLPRTASPGIKLADGAIGGDLTIESPAIDLGISADQVAGAIDRIEVARDSAAAVVPARPAGLLWFLKWLRTSLALLIFGAVAIWLTPRVLTDSREMISSKALPSTGWGCLTMAALPIVLSVLFLGTIAVLMLFGTLTLGALASPIISASGLLFAILTAGFNLLMWLARVAVALWVGRWILGNISPEMGNNKWLALLVGVLIYALLYSLPFIGFWLHVFWTGLGLGTLVLLSRPYWPGAAHSELASSEPALS